MRNALSSALLTAIISCLAIQAQTHPVIVLDGRKEGKVFEGIGGLSAGASSRLLIDFPEPQRSQVLDFLFKPRFGAAFQHLKVEIGGDTQSTDGSEPSYARTREEFEHPKPEYFKRGYEWWLLEQAKKRNPRILLDVLQWGAPGWIGDRDYPAEPAPGATKEQRLEWERKKFHTQDNADFVSGYVAGLQKLLGFNIDFCGIWNETPYDIAYIKLLRKTLDRKGLSKVKIIGGDQPNIWPTWDIAKDMLKDPELMASVHAIGGHYPGMLPLKPVARYDSTPEARQTRKPLYSSEEGPWRSDWTGSVALAKVFNRNYIVGGITKTIIWSLFASVYETLLYPDSGPLRASVPWSGHFEVNPAVWAVAHTTQFTEPGWKYLDGGCGLLSGESGSYVTLKSPRGGEYSIVIETVDAKTPQTLSFEIAAGLSGKPLQVWRTTSASQFDRLADVPTGGKSFRLTLEPGAIYSLTTTRGQQKGSVGAIPPNRQFPMPYRDDFAATPAGRTPRYFSDQGGTFEVALRSDGKGKCLRQTVERRPIAWWPGECPEPYTILGSSEWKDYEVSFDVLVERGGYASAIAGSGYRFIVTTEGKWELKAPKKVLGTGNAAFAAGVWHNLKLQLSGRSLRAFIDGVEVAFIADGGLDKGLAGFGTGWHGAQFANFSATPLPRP